MMQFLRLDCDVMTKKKRIGMLTITSDVGHDSERPIWATIWNSDDATCITIFFIQEDYPNDKAWFRSLLRSIKTGTWRIIMKGTYRYGYYYKIVGTTVVENGNKLFDELDGWTFKTPENITYKLDILKGFDTFNNEMLAHMI